MTLTSGVEVLGSGEVVLPGVLGVGTVVVTVVVPPGVVPGVICVGSSIPVFGGVARSAGTERSKIAGTAAAGAVSGDGPGGGAITFAIGEVAASGWMVVCMGVATTGCATAAGATAAGAGAGTGAIAAGATEAAGATGAGAGAGATGATGAAAAGAEYVADAECGAL
ncbi:hypothetical protein FEK35_16980 [Nocardia cyriacigeorgica]|uniref:Uncharacterized protein n=1 Tax=Nocardia cyriacigeorgica TaxID=135487 RepID=A0A5R8PDQ7_9NOCA|nr:hypothetical protein FEK35_16980 [Nocardia cyriacigeorgica]